jgi:transcriptional regulator with XRE-family HTH domain
MPKTIHTAAYVALIGRLKRRRLDLKLTQTDVAAKVGKDRLWLQRIESCQRRADFLETVDLLRVLGIKLSEAVRIIEGKS